MTERLCIRGGHVIDPATKTDRLEDIAVEKGVITTRGRDLEPQPGAKVIEAQGCIVAPGFIDAHCHAREPGEEYKETLSSATQAAVAGGFTAICTMPNTVPVNDNAAVTEFIVSQAAREGQCRVYPIGAISKGEEGKALAEIGEMMKTGIVAISDDGHTIADSELMRRALEYASGFDLPVIVHAEDPWLASDAQCHEGRIATALGLRGQPALAESTIVYRDIALARLTGARLHIAHLSAALSVELVRQAKKEGLKVTAEVTPHHLTLTVDALTTYDTHLKVRPPLRTKRDREALIAGLADGTIDCIATDHAPHTSIEKEVEFEKAASGMIGLETALPLVLRLVAQKRLTHIGLIRALSTRPAAIFRLPGGTLKSGSPADIVIFDPSLPWTIDPSRFFSLSRNSPFGGWKVKGRVRWTLVGGSVVYASDPRP